MTPPHPLDAVVEALSGVEHDASRSQHIVGLCARLQQLPNCKGITPKAVEKWFERDGGLPNKWRLGLSWLAQRDGIVISIPDPQTVTRSTPSDQATQ